MNWKLLRHAATAVVATGFSANLAIAARLPLTLMDSYADTIPADVKFGKGASCPVVVTSIVDQRRDPSMVGVYGKLAIKSPEDSIAWLRSILKSLRSRQIDISFAAEGAPPPVDGATADISLIMASIDSTDININANLILQLKAKNSRDGEVDVPIRGRAARMAWSGGRGELQLNMDRAIANGMDALAVELHKLCGQEPV